MKRFIIRDTISGTSIEEVDTLEEAKKVINKYIADDIAEGTASEEADERNYEDDFDEEGNCFYEIYDTEKEETIDFNRSDVNEQAK